MNDGSLEHEHGDSIPADASGYWGTVTKKDRSYFLLVTQQTYSILDT